MLYIFRVLLAAVQLHSYADSCTVLLAAEQLHSYAACCTVVQICFILYNQQTLLAAF